VLAEILFLGVIVVIVALVMTDAVRGPAEAPVRRADRRGHDGGRAIAASRSGSGAHASPRESAVRDNPGAGRPDEAARAFDQMRLETWQSASEAVLRGNFNAMHANLARRSQALVERQLRLIESLEQGEHDDQRLAALSRLSSIAMRMQRNSQNVLVLAGHETASEWNQPMTLAQLVQAAVAEIEDYQRVSFEVQPDIAVRGPAVHDTVHVLVELIDNAASFSVAEMPVHITGRVLPGGGALIDITDRGIGMAAKEMAYANKQLDNPPAGDIGVPKWMGLLVVARLAARHGIRVRLNQAEFGGLTALVWFPDEILTHYSGAASASPASADQRAGGFSPAPFVSAPPPDPGWPARGQQATASAGVVVPNPQSQATTRGLPIFEEVESRWSRTDREAPGSARPAAAPDGQNDG